jgi:uncharacterized protein with ParB-like and HNH nuclease domain
MNNETGAKSLNDIISEKKFCIPMYQRNYKWNSAVAEKLVTDIISSYEMKNDKSLGLITLYYEAVTVSRMGQYSWTTTINVNIF